MIGYHYTSFDNWLQIQKEGLIPYEIHKQELEKYFPHRKLMGIWVWTGRFYGEPHAGSVIYQVAYRATPHVVLLSVGYDEKDILKYHWPDGRWGDVRISHDGHVEKWIYHTGVEESVLVTKPIPPKKIHLVREYDLVKLLK
jgi:hypothetical protein